MESLLEFSEEELESFFEEVGPIFEEIEKGDKHLRASSLFVEQCIGLSEF